LSGNKTMSSSSREDALRLSPAFTLVSCSANSNLKMKAICSSETSVVFHIHIPEDSTLLNHRCENLKSYTVTFLAICFHAGILFGLLTLKMKAICSSETSVVFHIHIPENSTLLNHRCENLRSYTRTLLTSFPRVKKQEIPCACAKQPATSLCTDSNESSACPQTFPSNI
jgi:hypothetical protein